MVLLSLSPETATLVRRLRGSLSHRDAPAFLVGGVVRDALLGRAKGDIDLAVSGDAARAAQALGESLGATVVVLDAARQVYRLVSRDGGPTIDVTPVRSDVATDAALRDFTIDALAAPLDELDLDSGRAAIVDAVGGLEDLQKRQVRAVTEGVFLEDGARLLRAVRLAAELGFSIEPRTAALIRTEAHLLGKVAGERVRDELCRILAVPGASRHLRLMDELNLLTAAIPELDQGRDVEQPKEHYWDVLEHSIETVGAMEQVLRLAPGDEACLSEVPWDEQTADYFGEEISAGRTRAVISKIGALLHDVAKPATKTIEPDGRIRFLGHPTLGAQMSEGVLRRLRFSNRELRMVSTMVEEHLRPGLISRGEDAPSRRAVYRLFRDAGEVAVDTLFLSFADYMAARGPLMEPEEWRQYAGKIGGILTSWRELQAEVRPAKLVDGDELMRVYGLEPGPQIGTLLEAIRESHAAGEIASREEALALAGRLLRQRPSAS